MEFYGETLDQNMILREMYLKTKFYQIYFTMKSFSNYDKKYYNNHIDGSEDEENIYYEFESYNNVYLHNNKFYAQNISTNNIEEKPIIEAHKFLNNLIESLNAEDCLLKYYSLLDSQIGKDVNNEDCFQFSKTCNSYNQVKSDLKNCLFKKFCIFYTTEKRNQFNFLKYFNENYSKRNKKNTMFSDEENHCAYGFVEFGLMDDVVFINFDKIFNTINLEFPSENKENYLVSDEIMMRIHTLNMIIFQMHELSHNKIFKYALNQTKSKYSSNFNTPIIKLFSSQLINDSGFLIEKLVAVKT